jgi:hypothetical protein
MHWRHVDIGAQKGRDENYCGTVAMRYSETIIQRRSVQQNKVRGKQHLAQNRNVSFLEVLNTNRGTGIPLGGVGSSH